MRSVVPFLLAAFSLPAQRPPHNGPEPAAPDWQVLTGGTVHTEPGKPPLDGASVVIRAGRIVAVNPDGATPSGARAWDCSGLSIYAAFLDAHVGVDAPVDESRPTDHWSVNVLARRSALGGAGIDGKTADTLRKLGFGAAAIAPNDGVFRGAGAVVTLEVPQDGERRHVVRSDCYQSLGFRSRGDRNDYPRAQMGVIALMRQTLSDADWHRDNGASPKPDLEALTADTTLLFDTTDELEALRATKVAREFGRPALLLGSGTEFRRLDALQACQLPIVVPLAFAAPPRIDSIQARESVTLRQMLTWEHAPTNPRRLIDRGLTVALTTGKLGKRSRFHDRLRKAAKHGLTHDQAHAALTTTPARLLGVDDRLGRIAPGLMANLVVVDGRLGGEKFETRSIWIRGRHHEIETPPRVELAGRWSAALGLGGAQVDALEFETNRKATVLAGDMKVQAKRVRCRERQVDLTFDAEPLGGTGVVTLNAVVDPKRMFGSGVDASGRRFGWSARRTGELAAEAGANKEKSDEEFRARLDVELPVPFGAFGVTELPQKRSLIVRADRIWTSGPNGVVDNGAMLIRDGKIAWVGPASEAPSGIDAALVDASGLQVTPGLIDCHSHTGISRGVNEGTQAVTSEVRVQDVINPDDIGWYRELAGGLTAANQLHGSANPIGGQNSVVKLRWGVDHPDDMRLAGAPGGIKFALGENVKQSNRGNDYRTRYPQTRMGVEALMVDRFSRARDYAESLARGDKARRDLELEALAEILAGTRFVHCHSYRQDEILMLCRIAEQFDFTIGTFQHGLECYKVAEAVRKVARGASIFTDWWAYKFEVFDAIPQNGAILHEVGVTVSFNSDSNELARRMNGEAAKGVKYGGVAPADALKFVTLNPARQLGVEDRIGSLEKGKDADFVIWSGDPLSSMSRCLATYIDGQRYWSDEQDRELRRAVRAERERLFQILLTLDDSEFEDGENNGDDAALEYDNFPGECGCCDAEEAR